MKITVPTHSASTSPAPTAGPSPSIAPSQPSRVPTDAIETPVAGPLPNPYGVCPDTSRDRYAQTVAIGIGVAALAPVLPEIVEGSSLGALAAGAAARLGPAVTAAGAFAKAAFKQYAEDAAPLFGTFATRESAARAFGSQAWKATEVTARGAIFGSGLAASAEITHRVIDNLTHGGDHHHQR